MSSGSSAPASSNMRSSPGAASGGPCRGWVVEHRGGFLEAAVLDELADQGLARVLFGFAFALVLLDFPARRGGPGSSVRAAWRP